MTLDDLRAYAISRSLFPPTTLARAIQKLGFVQADPIRAPARAQDLTLRHRVRNYRAGDLERRYVALGIEEDIFINYGFVSHDVHALMHPRQKPPAPGSRTRAQRVLAFVRERGEVHPREVEAHFSHGTVTNYWGGSSNATTHLLENLHARGWVRVVRRDRGTRVYAIRDPLPASGASPRARVDQLVDVVVGKYAPLPARSLAYVVARLRYAVPQWRALVKGALARARKRLSHAYLEGHEWYWPADERVAWTPPDDAVRLLAPFDPVVWDRRRFEILWGWPYRFEAYTPAAKRKFGYYALPLLWRHQVIGWANLTVGDGGLRADVGYVQGSAPRERSFARALDAELDRMRTFLGL